MDILDDILFAQAARFHLVVQGICHVTFPSGDHIQLSAGDLALIPNGTTHVLSNSGLVDAPPLEKTLEDAGYDGSGVLTVGAGNPSAATQMICGHFTFRKGAEHPMLSKLPEYIHVTGADRAEEPWLDDALRLVSQRMFSGDAGSTATVARLSEIVFIELIKSKLVQSDDNQALLSALKDPNISQALNAIHQQTGEQWTVDSLAQHIGMSRSRFSDKFSQLMGVGPMRYLANWRLQKALVMLDEERSSIQQIALLSGYQSTAAFTRAFANKFGSPPTAYRRQMMH